MRSLIVVSTALLVFTPHAAAQEDAKPLTPADAAKRVNEQVAVQFEVRSSGGNRNRYLNSAANYASPTNFTVVIPEAAVAKFKAAGVERPEEHFYGKTITVTGTVMLARWNLLGDPIQRPQIAVTDPVQIQVVEDLSGPPVFKRTHIYKRIGSHSIRADSYRFHDRPNQPIVVWIHGGALMMGQREPAGMGGLSLHEAAREHGWVIVSLDYRLAPETKLPEIISDLEDAFRWIRTSGPELFQGDPERIAVVGGSAGGYLTLVSGFRCQPRPQVLVSYYGYGDLIGPWYSEPSPHHNSPLTAAQAEELLSGPPVSDARDRQHAKIGQLYGYFRKTGLWPKVVSGWDPRVEAEKFVPYMPVKNVTSDYPPTLLIHGDRDTDVPHEQSQLMAAELKKHNVEHTMISLAGAEHGLAGGKPSEVQAAHRSAIEFLVKQLAR